VPLINHLYLRWSAIIGLLACTVAVGGCSAVRLGYNNAPDLAYWWLDGYLDFDGTQSVRLRDGLQALQDWHRKDELPALAEMLRNLQIAAPQNVSPEQVCTLTTFLEGRLVAATEHMLSTAAALAPTLTPAQLAHMEKVWAKHNGEWRDDWLEGSPHDRAEYRLKKLTERAESFYGRLSDAQRKSLGTALEDSGFDAATQYRETLRKQKDIVQTLKALRGPGHSEAQVLTELRALMLRILQSPDPALRQYQMRVRLQGCALVAALHNNTSTTQRTKLSQVLADYEGDVRALLAKR
jgi:hypothetical protein